jgi:hypothetical protein
VVRRFAAFILVGSSVACGAAGTPTDAPLPGGGQRGADAPIASDLPASGFGGPAKQEPQAPPAQPAGSAGPAATPAPPAKVDPLRDALISTGQGFDERSAPE